MANVAILQVKDSFTATIDGSVVLFRQGDLVDGDHPVTRKYPQYFGPVTLQHPWRKAEPVIEQATAAPGEKRDGKRGDK